MEYPSSQGSCCFGISLSLMFNLLLSTGSFSPEPLMPCLLKSKQNKTKQNKTALFLFKKCLHLFFLLLLSPQHICFLPLLDQNFSDEGHPCPHSHWSLWVFFSLKTTTTKKTKTKTKKPWLAASFHTTDHFLLKPQSPLSPVSAIPLWFPLATPFPVSHLVFFC